MEENQTNNDQNMNDIINKFNNILKDKDINLGNIFNNNECNNNCDTNNSGNNNTDFNIDIETLLKFKDIFQKINDNNNPRNRLLYSLKPFLKDSRKENLDECIKIANLLVIMNIINDMNSLYLILIIILLTK